MPFFLHRNKSAPCLLALMLITMVNCYSRDIQKQSDSLYTALAHAKDDTSKVNILNELSHIEYQKYNNDTAIVLAKEADRLASRLQYKKGNVDAALRMGMAYIDKEDYYDALIKLNKALSGYKTLGDASRTAYTYYFIADAYFLLENFPEALKNNIASLKIYDSLHSETDIANADDAIGRIYAGQNNYKDALQYFKAAFAIYEKHKDSFRRAVEYRCIGIVYDETGNSPKALECFHAAEDLLKGKRYKEELLNLYNDMGATYINTKHYRQATKYLSNALSLNKSLDNKSAFSILYLNIGRIRLYEHQPSEARLWVQKSLNISTKITKNIDDIAFGYHLLAKTDSAMGNYKSAYNNLLLFAEYEDSLYQIENSKKTTQKLMQYEFEKKQANAQAAYRLALAEQKQTRRQWITGLSAIAVLLLLMAGFMFWRYRAKQKTAQQLALKNQKIETLIKELHHRVKNNMQVISSLLNLQSGKLENTAARDAFNEGISRMQAMSLIHQKLYLNDDVTVVNMKQYINSLTDSLLTTYIAADKAVAVHRDIDDVSIDIDTAVPLGLILNELLTNTLKYGINNAQPLLVISFNGRVLTVKDNGITPIGTADFEKSDSFGIKLIKVLVKQIKARLSIQSSNGTEVSVIMNNDE